MGYCPFPAMGHDTMCCIVTSMAWARMARCDTVGQACMQGVATRPGGAATRPAYAQGERQRAGARPGHWGVSRYNCLYRGGRVALCLETTCNTGCDTVRSRAGIRRRSAATCATRAFVSRYDFVSRQGRAATWRDSARGDTMLCTRPGCSVPAAWVPWVCALCTQPSFDSVHCLQSPFMEFKKNEIKIK